MLEERSAPYFITFSPYRVEDSESDGGLLVRVGGAQARHSAGFGQGMTVLSEVETLSFVATQPTENHEVTGPEICQFFLPI